MVEPSVEPKLVLVTLMFHTALEPWVKVPLWALVMLSDGGGSIVMVSEANVAAVIPAPLNVKPLTVTDAGAFEATTTGTVRSG